MNQIIKQALITEKSFDRVNEGKYAFVVATKASKDDIAAAVENLFSVKVLAVNTANIIGKIKRTKKSIGKRSNYKKAIVTLKPGQKIALFESEETKDQKDKAKSKKDKDNK